MPLIEAVGWAGSALLVISLLQGGMMRLRILNLIASVILIGYNALVETWPMAAVNAAVAIIDIFYIVKIAKTDRRRRADHAEVSTG
ncbi:hypothetical protein [Microbacterium gorillae]|uniref:hypothetical protein n=1 Tax=Microbacterium gorillae TaxID=1231063 RepID=UPI003D97F0BC